MTKFSGFRYEFEAGRDLVLGSILGAPLNETGDWQRWLPSPEFQSANGYEPNACVSFSVLNGIETYLNHQGQKLTRGWSDRFLAKASGTDPNSGNTYRNVLDTVRKLGVPLEDKWPSDGVVSLNDFYAPIPPALYKDAQTDFRDIWTVKYEEIPVESIPQMLKYSPILISVTAWFEQDGVYVDNGLPNNHAVLCFKVEGDTYYVFDSYDNAIKKYKGKVQQAKRIWVGKAEEQKSILLAVFEALKKNGLLAYFAKWWEENEKPPLLPLLPVEQTPMNSQQKLLEAAKNALGKELTPQDGVPDDVACAEVLSTLLDSTFNGFPIIAHTHDLFRALQKDKRFQATLDMEPGNIIISPTGHGNGRIRGHCGVILEDGIASNESSNGRWSKNFSVQGWVNRYRKVGALPIYVFKPAASRAKSQ